MKAAPAQPHRIMRVRWTKPTDSASARRWDEVFHLQQKDGTFRLMQNIPGNFQVAPSGEMLGAWFKRLGVTHVETYQDYHEEMPDGLHPIKKFVRWLTQQDGERLSRTARAKS